MLSLLAMAAFPLVGCGQHGPAIRTPEVIFGSPGEHDGQFHMPREVGFSPDGKELYILDRSHRVQAFTPSGEFLRMWPTPYGPLGNPRGLDVDKAGHIYVADTHNSQILVYTPQGKLIRKWGRYGKAPGQFISVTDVSLDPDGNVWTCEYGAYNDRIQKFTPEGKHLLTVGKFGDAPGEFSRPQGIAVDPRDGRVYVADAVNHRIQVLAPDGKPERMWGEPGAAPGKLRYPYDVSFDSAGRLFVAEYGNSRVSVFTHEGKLLACFGRPGHRPGEFDHPWGVNVARTGEVYVADTMNYRVQKFSGLWSVAGGQ